MFSKEQIKYIEDNVRNGMSLTDAIGQAEVLEEEAQSVKSLLRALSDTRVQEKIKEITSVRWEV